MATACGQELIESTLGRLLLRSYVSHRGRQAGGMLRIGGRAGAKCDVIRNPDRPGAFKVGPTAVAGCAHG